MKFLWALVSLPVMAQTAATTVMDLTIPLTLAGVTEAEMAKNTGGWIQKAVAAALKSTIGDVVVTPKKVGATMITAAPAATTAKAAATTAKAAATTAKAAATTAKAGATTAKAGATTAKAAATTAKAGATTAKAAATTAKAGATTAKAAATTAKAAATTAKAAVTTAKPTAAAATTAKAAVTTAKPTAAAATTKAGGRRLATMNIVVAVAVPTAKLAAYNTAVKDAGFAAKMKTQMVTAATASNKALGDKIKAGTVAAVVSAVAATTKAAAAAKKTNNTTAAPSDGAYHVSIWPVIGVLLMALSGSYLN